MPGPLTSSEQTEVDLAIGNQSGERAAWCKEVIEYLGEFKWAGNTADWSKDDTSTLAMNCWCAPIYIAYKKGRLAKKTVDEFSMKAFQYPTLSMLHASQRAAHEFLQGKLASGNEGVPGDLQFYYIDSLDGISGKSVPQHQVDYNASVPLGKCPVHVSINMGVGKSISLWQTPNDYDKYQYCNTSDLVEAIKRDRKANCTLTSMVPFWIAGKKSKSKCYITTAVCEAQGLEDDCHDLTALRWFRDEIMLSTPEGAAEVQEYYATAPGIVEQIDGRADALAIYAEIARSFIRPSVEAIDQGRFEQARAIYKQMVRMLASGGAGLPAHKIASGK